MFFLGDELGKTLSLSFAFITKEITADLASGKEIESLSRHMMS